MGTLRAKAKIASNKAAKMEQIGVFARARQWWGIAAIRWDRAGNSKNKSWCNARQHHCDIRATEEDEEELMI